MKPDTMTTCEDSFRRCPRAFPGRSASAAARVPMSRFTFPRVSRCRVRRFTLMELLIACLLFGILFASLAVVLRQALSLRDKSDERFDADIIQRRFMEQFREDVASLLPPTGVLASSFVAESDDSGEYRHDTVEFVTATGTPDCDTPQCEFLKLEYYLLEPEDDSIGEDLIRARSPVGNFSETPEPVEAVVLRRVAGLKLTYYDGSEWQDSWDSTTTDNELPEAIRLDVDFAVGDDEEEDVPPSFSVICQVVVRGLSSDSESGSGQNGDGNGDGGGS